MLNMMLCSAKKPEETEKGEMPLKFNFDILDNNLIPKEDFNEEFFDLIGDILVDIMDETS